MEQIKQWYSSLDEKDQKITIIAAIVVSLLLIYLILISPVNNAVSSIEKEVAAKQKTVNWMKTQVSIILSNKGGGSVQTSSQPLSSIVNTTTNRFSLPVSRRDSKSPNEMQIWFDNVSFDSFLRWSNELKVRHGVSITSANIRSQDSNGTTSINVKLIK